MGAIKQLPIEESAWFNKINTVGAIIVTRLCDAQNVFFYRASPQSVRQRRYAPRRSCVGKGGEGGRTYEREMSSPSYQCVECEAILRWSSDASALR